MVVFGSGYAGSLLCFVISLKCYCWLAVFSSYALLIRATNVWTLYQFDHHGCRTNDSRRIVEDNCRPSFTWQTVAVLQWADLCNAFYANLLVFSCKNDNVQLLRFLIVWCMKQIILCQLIFGLFPPLQKCILCFGNLKNVGTFMRGRESGIIMSSTLWANHQSGLFPSLSKTLRRYFIFWKEEEKTINSKLSSVGRES